MHVMKNRLIGTWALLSYESVSEDGTTRHPFGGAAGRLAYDEHGNMAGQVMRPGRHGTDAPGYIAYFGTYEVDAAGDTVIHHVEGALNPSWVGGDQVRRFRFDGDRLVLELDVPRGDRVFRHVLTWRRLP
jgi:hypothetical protein